MGFTIVLDRRNRRSTTMVPMYSLRGAEDPLPNLRPTTVTRNQRNQRNILTMVTTQKRARKRNMLITMFLLQMIVLLQTRITITITRKQRRSISIIRRTRRSLRKTRRVVRRRVRRSIPGDLEAGGLPEPLVLMIQPKVQPQDRRKHLPRHQPKHSRQLLPFHQPTHFPPLPLSPLLRLHQPMTTAS